MTPLRPVASELGARTSSIAARNSAELDNNVLAAAVPVIPLPIVTTSTAVGMVGD